MHRLRCSGIFVYVIYCVLAMSKVPRNSHPFILEICFFLKTLGMCLLYCLPSWGLIVDNNKVGLVGDLARVEQPYPFFKINRWKWYLIKIRPCTGNKGNLSFHLVKDKYGDREGDSSSSSETEDEDAEVRLTYIYVNRHAPSGAANQQGIRSYRYKVLSNAIYILWWTEWVIWLYWLQVYG